MKSGTVDLDPVTKKNVDLWLNGQYDEETKSTIQRLLKENPKEIVDAFYTNLSFGTAGMRGIMGVGCNRMNVYTIRAATQALANYIAKQPLLPSSKMHSVFIGYDSRHNSRQFAEEAAKVLAGNKIKVFLCKELRPTPLVSFGCRYKKCTSAIMITASHNPAEYNGYKVYWSDGGQVLPPHDQGIMDEFKAITDLNMIKELKTLDSPLIEWVGEEIDRAYIDAIRPLQNYPKENSDFGNKIKIVYTSLHGTGITLMPAAFEAWGFKDIEYVKKQIVPDGDFPTVKKPNPEEKAALELAIETLKQTNADILIATDPDADRVAIGVKHENEVFLFDGNQIACLCLWHICKAKTEKKSMPPRAAFVKSIGTTELFKSIAESYQKPCFNVLTGFKYIAEKIRSWEVEVNGLQFVFGGEESFGYLYGTQTRDKDAIAIGVLLSELALHAKLKNQNLVELLFEIYKEHGVYAEKVISIEFEESKEGKEKMAKGMERLRSHPPKQINGVNIIAAEDYHLSTITDFVSAMQKPLAYPKSDVLLFWLADKTKLMVRPSGTEPKIKIYCGVMNDTYGTIQEGLDECEERIQLYVSGIKKLLHE